MNASEESDPLIQLTVRKISPISALLQWRDPLTAKEGGVLYIVLRIEHHTGEVLEVGRTPMTVFIDGIIDTSHPISYVICGGRDALYGESNRVSPRVTLQ